MQAQHETVSLLMFTILGWRQTKMLYRIKVSEKKWTQKISAFLYFYLNLFLMFDVSSCLLMAVVSCQIDYQWQRILCTVCHWLHNIILNYYRLTAPDLFSLILISGIKPTHFALSSCNLVSNQCFFFVCLYIYIRYGFRTDEWSRRSAWKRA